MRINKTACLLLSAAWTCSLLLPAETEVAASESRICIEGFPSTSQITSLYPGAGERPSFDQITAQMPDSLEVFLEGEETSTYIPVEWTCVGDDYASSEAYYFQFSPVFDSGRYVLADEINLETEVPYISVFLSPETDASASGISLLSVTGAEYEEFIFHYLTTEAGLNSAAACGIMANMVSESAFQPNILQVGSQPYKDGYTSETYTAAVDDGTYTNFVNDKAGYGLCQWTFYTLKEELLNYAKSLGVSIGDCSMQLSLLQKELSTDYQSLWSKLNNVPNTPDGAYEAGYQFCYNFERPSDTESRSQTRGNLARDTYWAEYGDPNAPVPEKPDPVPPADSGTAYKVSVNTSLCVRAQPNTSAEILGALYDGNIIYVHEITSGWGCINYDGKVGYVSLDYCKLYAFSDGTKNGLVEESGQTRYYESGQLFTGGYKELYLNKTSCYYYFDKNGNAFTGGYKEAKVGGVTKYFYFKKNGRAFCGGYLKVTIDGKPAYFYFKKNGQAYCGGYLQVKIDGTPEYFYFGKNGQAFTEGYKQVKINGANEYFYFRSNGRAFKKGYLKLTLDGTSEYFYFRSNGRAFKNGYLKLTLDDKPYYFFFQNTGRAFKNGLLRFSRSDKQYNYYFQANGRALCSSSKTVSEIYEADSNCKVSLISSGTQYKYSFNKSGVGSLK